MQEKFTQLSIQAPYCTYGNLNSETQYLWMACHGFGQMARNFIRRFDVFPENEHYVIAPQGLSRFYLHGEYQHVGASWMTKEYREVEIEHYLNYLDKIWQEEILAGLQTNPKICLMGFSQGVATIARWAIMRGIKFDKLVLWAGSFPKELEAEGLSTLSDQAEICFIVGKEDNFINTERLESEVAYLKDFFQKDIRQILFDGKHEVTREVLKSIIVGSAS